MTSFTHVLLTLELANGDILTSYNYIYNLFKNSSKYTHLIYDARLNVHPPQGNDFFYEIYPSGCSALRRSFSSTISNKLINTSELLEDIAAVLKAEAERCRALE